MASRSAPVRLLFYMLTLVVILWLVFSIHNYRGSPRPQLAVAQTRRSSLRVAVVIVGDLRTFRIPAMRGMLVKHVLGPLRSAGHNTHTFFHTDDVHFLKPSVLEPFKPATVTLREANLTCPPTPECETTDFTTVYASFSLCRLASAWKSVEEEEQNAGAKFNWVYKIRPDIGMLRNLPLPEEVDEEMVHMNFLDSRPECAFAHFSEIFRKDSSEENVRVKRNSSFGDLGPERGQILTPCAGDMLAIMHRKFAEIHFSVAHAFLECPLRTTPCKELMPEYIVSYWHAKHNIRVRKHSWFWFIVRENIGPLCEQLRRQQMPDVPWAPLWRECRELQKLIAPGIVQLAKIMENRKKTFMEHTFADNLFREEELIREFEGPNAKLFGF